VEIRTERLVLRPIEVGDAAMVHEYRGDPSVVTYLTHPALDLDQTRERLTGAAASWSTAGRKRFNLTFAVVLGEIVIGDVHVWNTPEPFQPASADPAEVWVGYAFNPRFHGHGYATEAMRALVGWSLERGVERIYANFYAANTSSHALLKRLGFDDHQFYSAAQDESGKNLASCQMRYTSSHGL
jgi:RimJ/RimL family protein N-acetyltransferase